MNETKTAECEVTNDEMSPSPWERLLREMREGGLTYGTQYPVEMLENRLMCQRESLKFGMAMGSINRELGKEGFYLSARDQAGRFYQVATPERCEAVADSKVRASFRELVQAIALFNGIAQNPEAKRGEEDKRRLLAKAEKNAWRLAMMRKPVTCFKASQKQLKAA